MNANEPYAIQKFRGPKLSLLIKTKVSMFFGVDQRDMQTALRRISVYLILPSENVYV